MNPATARLLKDVEQMQYQLRIASLQGARMVILKLAQGNDWPLKQRKELENQAESIQWAIDKLTLSTIRDAEK